MTRRLLPSDPPSLHRSFESASSFFARFVSSEESRIQFVEILSLAYLNTFLLGPQVRKFATPVVKLRVS